MAESEDSTKPGVGAQAAPQPGEESARVQKLEAELAAARDEGRQAHERWLRERADLDNMKKRAAKERSETIRYANESVFRDLLAVVDNLERAVEHSRGGGNGKSLVEGVELVL